MAATLPCSQAVPFSSGRILTRHEQGPCQSLRLVPRPTGQLQSIRRRSTVAPRATDLKDHGPGKDEWRPPSDWDNAWSMYKKGSAPSSLGLNKGPTKLSPGAGGAGGSGRGKPNPFKHMEQYVTRDPNRSNYPLAEEVDSLRRTEREALRMWTDVKFTYAGFGVVALMLAFMVVAGPPSS